MMDPFLLGVAAVLVTQRLFSYYRRVFKKYRFPWTTLLLYCVVIDGNALGYLYLAVTWAACFVMSVAFPDWRSFYANR